MATGIAGVILRRALCFTGTRSSGVRRLRADLILSYKIIRRLVLLSPDSFFTFVCNSRTRCHSFKLFLPDLGLMVNCRQHLFAVRVLRIWNSLPEDVVSAAHLSLFISRLVPVSDRQDVGALMCSVFIYLDLHY